MKLNKYIFATLITSTTLFLGSCSDFLDRSPQGQFTEDDNPNALVNGKIYNVYTLMRNYDVTAGPPALAIHCFRSEDSEKGSISSDGSDVAEMYDDFVSVSYTHLTLPTKRIVENSVVAVSLKKKTKKNKEKK